ncbi:MAG: caspase family protein [Alphaproteobacteria bacterium]
MAAVVLLGSVSSALAADAERRVALVLGYSDYKELPPLENPTNDATAIASLLREVGFEVVEGFNQTREEALTAVRDFGTVADGAQIGLIYYAGHGIQVGGRNFLVPVDASPRVAADLAFEGIAMDDLINQVQARAETVLFFLDACRDNPLPTYVASLENSPSRSLDAAQGLAPINVDVGSFTSFATGPNRVAYDGENGHSPYTSALLDHLATPGLEIRSAMDLVRREVVEATKGQQVPWDHSSLMGPVHLVKAEGESVDVPLPAVADADGVFWNTLQRIAVPDLRLAALQIYQRAFPSGRFAEVAEVQLASFDGSTVLTEPAQAELVPAVATSDMSDLIYWQHVNQTGPATDAATAYLANFPTGLFSEQAKQNLLDARIDLAALDLDRDPQAVDLITRGGPQLLNLPVPTVRGGADVSIVSLPEGRLEHPTRGVLEAGSRLPLSEVGDLRFEPLGESQKDYGEVVLRTISEGAEPVEWATPLSVHVHDCDLLASDPLDPNRVSTGTYFFDGRFSEEDKDVWANGAVIACLKGASDYPSVDRFQANLGRAYAGIEDYEEAKSWLMPLVEHQNPLAENLMGLMYKNGWGVEQNDEAAFPLFLAAAETGHAGAQHDVAWAYGEGRGVAKDDAKMAEWMAKSAASGYHQAQYNMGRLYLWGRGVERDVDAGIELLKAAAAQGQQRANYDLADLYERGEGFAKDESKARQLFESAVKVDYPPAYLRFARLLIEGRGGPVDLKGGLYHLARAATSSSERTSANAEKRLAELPKADAIRVVQKALADAGFEPGPVDGVMGGRTQAAIESYRRQQGLDEGADVLDPATLVSLLAPSEGI